MTLQRERLPLNLVAPPQSVLRKHPLVALFLIALAVRAVLALTIFHEFNGTLFLDDATYSDMAAQRATGQTAHWDAYTYWLYDRTATMLIPMTFLYKVVGASRIVGQLLVAVLGAATAVVTARVAAEAVCRRAALVAGLGIALLPSQVLFSATTMKDAFVWFLLATLSLAAALAGRQTGRRLAAVGVLTFVALLLLGYLRLHTQAVAAWSVMLVALIVPTVAGRRWLVPAALVIGLSAPWLSGTGPGGLQLVVDHANASYLEGLRAAQSVGGSALAVPGAPVGPAKDATGPTTLGRPAGPANPTVAAPTSEDDATATLSYLPHGVVAVLLGPYPWHQTGSAAFRAAGIENLLWYGLLLLALLGAPAIWLARRVTAFPLIVSCGCLLMWALVEGNEGTAFRHRGEFVWAVWILAVVGGVSLLNRFSPRVSTANATHQDHEPVIGSSLAGSVRRSSGN